MASKSLGLAFAAATLLLNISAASAATIDFDQVTNGAFVNNFYNGGTDTAGASGPNLGVAFFGFFATSVFGLIQNPPSAPQFATGLNDPSLFVSAGFTGSISFEVESNSLSVLILTDITNGSTILANVIVPNSLVFVPETISFSGTAKFILFQGTFGIDDLQITPTPPVNTPLPTTLPLFATGLGALGLLGWRRKRKQVPDQTT